MRSPDAILTGLTVVANEWRTIAILWHAALAIGLLALLRDWRPSNCAAGYLLAMPFLSVNAAAWAFGNP